MYGTTKPTVGIISTFPQAGRQPDQGLRDHLLALAPLGSTRTPSTMEGVIGTTHTEGRAIGGFWES